jgi:hypothetical protein
LYAICIEWRAADFHLPKISVLNKPTSGTASFFGSVLGRFPRLCEDSKDFRTDAVNSSVYIFALGELRHGESERGFGAT